MLKKEFYSLSQKEILNFLNTKNQGLSEKEAKERLKKFGKNKLPKKDKGKLLFVFLSQFNNLLVYILFLASFISWIFDKKIDAVVILVIIFLNALFGFFQSWKAERTLEALKKMVSDEVVVLRDGKEKKISAENLVLGDIVILSAGDKVPADIRLLKASSLSVDESSLTGESVLVEKNEKIKQSLDEGEYPKNMIFMGTVVVRGECKGVVVQTGKDTLLGSIAEQIRKIKPQKSFFEKSIENLVIKLGIGTFIIATLIFLVGFFVNGLEFFQIFMFSVAVLVAGVPEGLPAALTAVLAISANKMAKRNAIARGLSAVESLGVVDVICTDKTGTLTKNELSVKRIYIGDELFYLDDNGNIFNENQVEVALKFHRNLNNLILGSLFLSDASITDTGEIGDPLELAFERVAKNSGISKLEILKRNLILDKIPFDNRYKYKAVLVDDEFSKSYKLFVSGAFEVILEKSSFVLSKKGEKRKILDSDRKELLALGSSFSSEAFKVIAFAYKEISEDKSKVTHSDLNDLVFLGLVALEDPPREEVYDAIAKCKLAGIRIIMMTGDHKETALAIAKRVELVSNEKETALTEKELSKLSDLELLEYLKKVNVFARITPKTKFRIVSLLQKNGNRVAMTGDGVNDALALKQADVGVAMGKRGTAVAKEASKIVLMDDNFASIVEAVLEGRNAFYNIQKTTFYLVITNLAEMVTLFFAMLFGGRLPFSAIQILWLNLITDGLPVMTLALEKKQQKELISKKPKDYSENILNKEAFPLAFFSVFIMVFFTLLLFKLYLPQGIEKARTMAFSFMAISQFFNLINMRSLAQSVFKIGFFSNKVLSFALFFSFIFQILIVHVPFFQNIFGFVPLNIKEWVLVSLLASLVFVVVEIYKRIRYR